jgi:RNA-directed DNA polymerase
METSLHTYLNALREAGASPAYVGAIQRNAQPLIQNGLPVILSLGQLSHTVGVSHKYLMAIVARKIDPYRVFTIRKRLGGKRFICVPSPELLSLQRFIHDKILCAQSVTNMLSANATAYRPGSSHIANAFRHGGAKWLIKLDITSFFESISERQIYHVFRKAGYRALVTFCLARLCTRVLPTNIDWQGRHRQKRWKSTAKRKFLNTHVLGHLPQGAPTSPMLANLVCIPLDKRLQHVAVRTGLIYTRYADDLTFSGHLTDRPAASMLIGEISKVVSEFGFSINLQKTNVATDGARKIVTGLSVTDQHLRLPRSYKDELRQELYFLKQFGLHDHCTRTKRKNHLAYLMRLAGKIEYAIKIEPILGKRLAHKFEALFPDFNKMKEMI